jgi:diguanylate cyclase (GGDEF)-like protein/PAS domain S-box-containing protein
MEDVHWPLQVHGSYLPDDPAIGGFAARLHLLVTESEPLDGAGADFPTLAESVPIGMIAATVEDRLTFCNGLARALVGPVDPRDALAWVDLARAEHRPDLHRIVANARQGRGREFVVAGFDRPDGTTRWLRVEAVPQADRRGVPSGWLVTLLDLTSETLARQQLQQAQDQLWHLANHDPLTGLPNRMLFSDRLEVALARTERGAGHQVAVLYCDLDDFKPINDRHGHDAGDRVLQVVARRLGAEVRASDTVCRFGGDEFVVLCEAYGTVRELDGIAGRLIGATSDPVDAGDVQARVGLSVGIAIATPGEGAISLLSRADGALYRAKTEGGGRVAVAR